MKGGLEERLRIAKWEYDFAKEGGAVGDITLTRGHYLPAGAIIQYGFVDVVTALAGATATVALKLEGAADILAATGVATFSLNALIACVPDFATPGDWVRTTAKRQLIATVATAALTAGKFVATLAYTIRD